MRCVMLVRELLEILAGLDPEAEVLVHDFHEFENRELDDVRVYSDGTVSLFGGEMFYIGLDE